MIQVDWATWQCAKCCWTVPADVREESACMVEIRHHIAGHEQIASEADRAEWTRRLTSALEDNKILAQRLSEVEAERESYRALTTQLCGEITGERMAFRDLVVSSEQREASLRADQERMREALRSMFVAGIRVAKGYGDNAIHLEGDQLERQFQRALAALSTPRQP